MRAILEREPQMITEETARKQLDTLHQEGMALAGEFESEQRERQKLYGDRERKHDQQLTVVIHTLSSQKRRKKKPEGSQAPEPPPEQTRFGERYQAWYSRALPLMKQWAPDRHAEFQSFYAVDPRYSWREVNRFVIQDYLRGRGAEGAYEQTVCCFKNQLAILKSVSDRLSWSTPDTADHLLRGQQLALLETARELIKISERAAGVIAGSVLCACLKALAAKHQVRLRKLSPSAGELAEALKEAKVFDLPVWSQVTWAAEIHGRCFKEGEGPTKLQVRDLIDGTRWLLSNVF
jgi:hypothetical protein